MAKIELDDQILEHPKFIRATKLAGSDSVYLWLGLRAYCAQQLSDGFIPSDMIDEVRGPRDGKRRSAALDALKAVGLVDDCENGVSLHDYTDHASSRDQVLAWRKANAERKRKSREKSANSGRGLGAPIDKSRRDVGVTDAVTDGVTTSGLPEPSPSPSPSPSPLDPPEPAKKTKQPKSKTERTSPPDELVPTEATLAKAIQMGCDWQAEWERCRDHHLKKGNMMADWNAALRTWLGNTPTFGKAPVNPKPPQPKQQLSILEQMAIAKAR